MAKKPQGKAGSTGKQAREKPEAAAGPAPAAPAAPQPRKIAVFSDGTGNSASKLFKTNVWRLYEAVELGKTSVDPKQLVFYGEGVGNSGFRPLAILGGVFGWGLKRNVLALYAFLCRNYRQGDQLYAFGFSRGAFTIRVLIGLIDRQGLVPYRDDADLSHQVADAYRAYIGGHYPRFPPMRWLLPLWRWLVRRLIWLKRTVLRQQHYDRKLNRDTPVRFVGVWDTVSAYGGPILELVRGFDDWIRPLTFKDQVLPSNVERARHALALDDERDSFQPLPWDEPFGTDRKRLKQVWFSGMHADVGGGYPDDSLAYVSLAWMMEEAQTAGLDLRAEKVAEANRVANAFGPIHDSRSGLGAYYRYQPRLVGAYVEPPQPGTESIEDPEFHQQGLNHCTWVHESVFHRIADGTDGYAPITLPQDFRVVNHDPGDTSFPQASRDNLTATSAERADHQQTINDRVWVRRILYFAIVLVSLVLATMPLWRNMFRDPFCGDSRCVLGIVIGWLDWVLPGFAKPWIEAFAARAGLAISFAALIGLLLVAGGVVERSLRDRTRRLWDQALAGAINGAAKMTLKRRIRTSRAYQGVLGFFKWQLLPSLSGILMLAILAYGVFVGVTQIWLAWQEPGTHFCAKDGRLHWLDKIEVRFDTRRPCISTGTAVKRGESYDIVLELPRDSKGNPVPWYDRQREATPAGIGAVGRQWLGVPLRRVVRAEFLKPLIEVRHLAGDPRVPWANISPLDLKPVAGAHHLYTARFIAPETGSLHLFVNDSAVPWARRQPFYENNCGTARIVISHVVHPEVEASVDVTQFATASLPIDPCVAEHPPGGGKPPAPPAR
jgi:uncharacterized protein (DUF2235 family)